MLPTVFAKALQNQICFSIRSGNTCETILDSFHYHFTELKTVKVKSKKDR